MSVGKYLGEVVREGKRVRWPKRDDLLPAILVVVTITVLFALLLYVEDLAGNRLIDILRDAFKGSAVAGE